MADEEAAAKDLKGLWPAKQELEKWLMNTAKDADHSAGFLRKMLQMNPAYGAYLASDEDLAGIVQLFAKRFRAKILATESPMQMLREDTSAKFLYEPLCEISWRVIGHLLHTILDLEDTENFPVPKEALGQVKMLLQTNVALSKKFNDMRRAYLRELSGHRDRQRVLSEKAQAAVNSLQEQPVMFYEPLEFVLDESTKQFIQEVVEERMKLDMQGVRVTRVAVEKEEKESKDGDPEKNKMYGEMKTLRTAAAKAQAQLETAMEETKRAKAQALQYQQQMERMEGELDDLRKQLDGLQKQRNDLTKKLQQAEKGVPVEIPEQRVEVKVETKVEQVTIEKEKKTVIQDKSALEEVKKLQEKIKQLEKEKKDLEALLEEARNKPPQTIEVPVAKPEPVKVIREVPKVEPVKEVIISKDASADELRKQLQKHLQIEKELREANKALEQALEESKTKVAKYRAPKGEPQNVDEEIEKAMEKVTEEHTKKVKNQAAEIERLKAALAEAQQQQKPKKEKVVKEVEEEPEKKPKKVKEIVMVEGDGEGKSEKWKQQYKELEEKYEDLQHEYEKLEHQVRMLLDKIKKYGGKEAVEEALMEVKLKALPPRKKRKKKAYERLYEDAQRRILDMQKRRMELEKQEKKLLISAASRVYNRKSLRQVENLTHLHKASVATQSRFHDALSRFHQEHSPQSPDGHDESGTSDEEAFGSTSELNSPSQRQGLDDGWTPEVVAAEFQRLRSENRWLVEEIGRLRALLPSSVAGGDPAFMGLQHVPLASKSMLSKAEQGKNLGSSLASLALGLGASLSGKQFDDRPRRTNSPSNSQSPPPLRPGRAPPLLSSQPSFGQLTMKRQGGDGIARGTREAQLAGSGNRTPSPPGSRGSTPKLPWRQGTGDVQMSPGGQSLGALLQRPLVGTHANTWAPGELGGTRASSREGPGPLEGRRSPSAGGNRPSPLGRSASAALLMAGAPQLSSSSLPWRREVGGSSGSGAGPGGDEAMPGTALPPGWSPVLSPLPPGQASRVPGPERGLGIHRRVPTSGALEPITRQGGSRSPRRQADSPEQPHSPAPMPLSPAAPVPGVPPRPPSGLSTTLPPGVLAASTAGVPGVTVSKSAGTLPGGVGEAGAARGQQAGNKGPRRRSVVAPKDDHLHAPVKAKASGFLVTALRSQESMLAMSHAQ